MSYKLWACARCGCELVTGDTQPRKFWTCDCGSKSGDGDFHIVAESANCGEMLDLAKQHAKERRNVKATVVVPPETTVEQPGSDGLVGAWLVDGGKP